MRTFPELRPRGAAERVAGNPDIEMSDHLDATATGAYLQGGSYMGRGLVGVTGNGGVGGAYTGLTGSHAGDSRLEKESNAI